MRNLTLAAAVLATLGLSATAYAAGPEASQNNSPQSSSAAMPKGKKHSAGTVGAMNNNAGGNSFTASKNTQKNVHLDSKK